MKIIKNAIFLKSMENFEEYNGFNLPEIVLVGRSNVGKSSLINMLAGNSKLARVSSAQGKTRFINFFLMNGEFILTDMPGYGYAKASKVEQQKWGKMIDEYFEKSKQIVAAILLVDVRLTPTALDQQMFDYFTFHNIPVTIVATKYDKIKKSERMAKLAEIARVFKVGVENIYLSSSETAFGKTHIIERIYQFVDGEQK